MPEPGSPQSLAPGLVRLTAPNPGRMTGPGTNTYLVGRGDLAVVDPGPDDPAHVAAIEAAAEAAGGRIRWILVTHTHRDHAPAAAPLAGRTGALRIGMGPRDGFDPDTEAGDGWRLEGHGFSLVALYTPGHASNHLCWLLEGEGILLTGDHVMHGSTVVIAPPDGDMASYLVSLGRLLSLGPAVQALAPGHGRLIAEPGATVRGIIAHRLEREAAVLSRLTSHGPATVDGLVGTVYADVHPGFLAAARLSLWAHLRMLAADGRVEGIPGGAASPEPVAGNLGPDHPELGWSWRAR